MVTHTCMPVHTSIRLATQEGYAWVHNAQLQRLTLQALLHGEAANLRHTPECLCFVFYAMAHSAPPPSLEPVIPRHLATSAPPTITCLPVHAPMRALSEGPLLEPRGVDLPNAGSSPSWTRATSSNRQESTLSR